MNKNECNATNFGLSKLAAASLLLLAVLTAQAAAQVSTDPDSPTPMTTNVVAGKSNGKARTHYYSFVATAADPGEVKVKVTASTDERSTNLRVNLLDEDGQTVMNEIYVIPNRDPATKVGKHTFAERQKVVLRVTLPEDPQVKLLNYRVEVTGAVEFEQPAVTADPSAATPTDAGATPPDPTAQAAETAPAGAEQMGQQTQGGEAAAADGQPKKGVKQKVKEGAKKAGKSVLFDVLKENPR